MQTFRAYLLNAKSQIVWADWIDAENEQEAMEKAKELCSKGKPVVELWQGARPIAKVECDTHS